MKKLKDLLGEFVGIKRMDYGIYNRFLTRCVALDMVRFICFASTSYWNSIVTLVLSESQI